MCNKAAAQVSEERRESLTQTQQLRLDAFPAEFLQRPTINPTDPMPIIVNQGPGLGLVLAAWGKPDSPLATMNARSDNLDQSPLWTPLVRNRHKRAVAVLSHGFEPFTRLTHDQMGHDLAVRNVGQLAVDEALAGKTVWHGIKRRDGQPMLIAALMDVDEQQRTWTTLVTTEAGPVFSRLHRAKAHGEPREIANLRSPAEAWAWLGGGEYGALLRGAGEDFMESWRCPPDSMKKDADPLLKMQAWTPAADKQRRLF